jgi:serine O-acetyltransferase
MSLRERSTLGIGEAEISAEVPDWTRESKTWFEWSPSRSLLASIRAYQRYVKRRSPAATVLRWLAILRHRWWSIVTGADIPLTCKIGGGLLIPHPNGIVIHPEAVVGPNCLIFQQVTLGITNGAAPTLAGHVDVGAGAKILGGVGIGAHAKIGANAVVVRNVPDGATAAGVPAKILRSCESQSSSDAES